MPFSARDTVAVDTPARAATSLIAGTSHPSSDRTVTAREMDYPELCHALYVRNPQALPVT